MDTKTIILLSLGLLQNVLENLKVSGAAIEVIQDIEASIAKLISVRDSEVTWDQLDELRIKKLW